jgi:hypothetical protein
MSPSADYRDLVITQFANDEARLLDDFVELACERDAYREFAQEALHTVHELTTKCTRLSERLRDVLEETRLLRLALRRERPRRAA